jgi:protein SCO1/2
MQKIKVIFLFCFSFLVSAKDIMYLETPKGGDFSIETTARSNFKTADLRGKTIFLFFGYTNCPNVCPLTLSKLKRLSKELEKSNLKDYHVLFISVDYVRDTHDVLKKYITPFGPAFSAGVTNEAALRKIIALFGARFSKVMSEKGKPLFDHTDSVFIISPDGKWRNTISFNAPYSDYYQSYVNSKVVDLEREKRIEQLRIKRELVLIDKVKNCNLSVGSCKYNFDDNTYLNISLSPLPIQTEKEFKVIIETNSSDFIPLEVDFEGVQQNMGYIRPALQRRSDHSYSALIELPLCEQKDMDWKLRLILKDKKLKRHLLEFYFSTKS